MSTKAKSLPFKEAIDHFKGKVNLSTEAWTDLWEGMHARAFVVAGAMKDDLLCDFHSAITKALEEGTTLNDFRRQFDTIVERHGWSYNGSRGWRSRTIYDTNLRQAHMTGRWKQVQGNKALFPYLRYVPLTGGNRRQQHQAWRNTVLPVDHPWWDTHYPMNGWGCKCTVVSMTEGELKRQGLSVSDDPATEMEKHTIKTPDGEETVFVPKGVAPGFAYNPGKADMGRLYSEADKKRLQECGEWKKWESLTKGDWKTAGAGERLPVDTPQAKIAEKLSKPEEVTTALEYILGGPEKLYTLPDGSNVLIHAETLGFHIPTNRSPYIGFLPELLENPSEIWLSFMRHKVTGKVVLRKRLLKQIRLDKNRTVMLVADAQKGRFTGWTYYPTSKPREVSRNRQGTLVWARKKG